MSSSDNSDDKPMSTDMLEDIREVSQYHPSINRREARYKIYDRIKQGQAEWKGALLPTQKMGKGSHKVFNAFVNDILQALPMLGESVSEVFYCIPEPRNFAEVTGLSEDTKKFWLKENLKYIKDLINNHKVLVQYPYKGVPMTPLIDAYKVKINVMEVLTN